MKTHLLSSSYPREFQNSNPLKRHWESEFDYNLSHLGVVSDGKGPNATKDSLVDRKTLKTSKDGELVVKGHYLGTVNSSLGW
jgi:hypothetical protein